MLGFHGAPLYVMRIEKQGGNDMTRCFFDNCNYPEAECAGPCLGSPRLPPSDERKEPRLYQAIDSILKERRERYGQFSETARISQGIKAAIFDVKINLALSSDQREALDMIALKIARIVNGDPDHADSWIGISGYAKLIADRLQGIGR